MSDFEKIKENYQTYIDIIERFEDSNLNALFEQLGERVAVAPANAQKDEYGCKNGGLVELSLEVLSMMRKLNAATGKQCEPKSLFKVALLHDLGRIGTVSNELFLQQDSDWHYEKLGMHFKKNQELYEYAPTQFTFQILSNFGVKLTEEEYSAIQSVQIGKPLNHLGRILMAARTMIV